MNAELEVILKKLDGRAARSPLMPKQADDRELEAQIEALDWKGRGNETSVIALMAGLHLRNDSLDLSHSYAQQIEHDATGAYWHGIMHRMEGDFFNSKYWFRMAGQHPAMARTRERVSAWLNDGIELRLVNGDESRAHDTLRSFKEGAGWAPAPFVDLIMWQEQQAATDAIRPILEEIQHIEMAELFAHTLACLDRK